MKYRNFDPSTDQPISAVDLLKKYNEFDEVKIGNLDITKVIAQSNSNPTDEDLTSKLLKRFDKIANIINTNAIKKKSSLGVKRKENLTEFDKYLKNKYPLADIKTEEKLTILLKERIKEIVDDRK
ncbi:hypothetical protein CANINC_004361 [Pichia inconspicua]|uniref:Uncharacterized protein n=1 Tax=Pichia inconspicua TaxID=52247 RepID=A0A4T0WWZ2_9ASCO|nr:hypothetical protein CANINC_004361 [[Candida] inconspicua]